MVPLSILESTEKGSSAQSVHEDKLVMFSGQVQGWVNTQNTKYGAQHLSTENCSCPLKWSEYIVEFLQRGMIWHICQLSISSSVSCAIFVWILSFEYPNMFNSLALAAKMLKLRARNLSRQLTDKYFSRSLNTIWIQVHHIELSANLQ